MYVVIPTAERPSPSLPYALASIAQHTDYTPITIGHDLGLCDLHIPTTQIPGVQHARRNTNLAMRVACESLGQPFVWSNDDIYWLKPAAPIMWAIGKLEDATDANKLNRERKAETARQLTAEGWPTFDYEAHVPMMVDPVVMLPVLDIVDENPLIEKRSLYGNQIGLPDRVAPDVKLRNPVNRHRDVEWASTQGDPSRWRDLADALT